MYAGMSKNLHRRIHGHQVKSLLENKYGYIMLYFKRCDMKSLRSAEKELIKKFNPPYNLQHRTKG